MQSAEFITPCFRNRMVHFHVIVDFLKFLYILYAMKDVQKKKIRNEVNELLAKDSIYLFFFFMHLLLVSDIFFL